MEQITGNCTQSALEKIQGWTNESDVKQHLG